MNNLPTCVGLPSIRRKPRGLIISALGRQSFSEHQAQHIESVLDVTFHAQLDPIAKADLLSLASDTEILAITRRSLKNFDAELIQALPHLRGLAIYSTGYHWVDVECLNERGILLSYLPSYATISVAEHALMMLLTLSRRSHLSMARSKGELGAEISLRGWEVRGKRLGIIGMGRIGQAIAHLARGFGLDLYYYDPHVPYSHIAKFLDWSQLLPSVDVVMLAASHQRNAAPLIGAAELQVMRPGAYLINPSCAELVDHAAVVEALRQRHLNGYAIDDSIPNLNHPDIEPGRIIQTNHTAWYADEALIKGRAEWSDNIIGLALNQPQNLVNFSAVHDVPQPAVVSF